MTPLPKRGFGPPSYGTFSTPLRCQCSFSRGQKSTTKQTRSSFGGVQKFSGERVLWYVFLPPYVLHPPYHGPIQTPNSVSFSALTEFRGESLVSSSQPTICVRKRTHRVFCRTHRVCLPQNSERLSEFSSPKQHSRNGIPPVSYFWDFPDFSGDYPDLSFSSFVAS